MKMDQIIEKELQDTEFKELYLAEKERSASEIALYPANETKRM